MKCRGVDWGRTFDYYVLKVLIKRDVYFGVELTGRPTIRVVSHL